MNHQTQEKMLTIAGTTYFPSTCCGTRCLENKKDDQVLCCWENLKKTVVSWKKLHRSKQPHCNSFAFLKSVVNDKFTKLKLEFFSFIAGYLEPYLRLNLLCHGCSQNNIRFSRIIYRAKCDIFVIKGGIDLVSGDIQQNKNQLEELIIGYSARVKLKKMT